MYNCEYCGQFLSNEAIEAESTKCLRCIHNEWERNEVAGDDKSHAAMERLSSFN